MCLEKKLFGVLIMIAVMLQSCHSYHSMMRHGDHLLYHHSDYNQAITVYHSAYAFRPDYRPSRGLAKAYLKLNDYPNSYLWWKEVVRFSESKNEDLIQLIKVANQLDSISNLEAFLGTLPPDVGVVGNRLKDSVLMMRNIVIGKAQLVPLFSDNPGYGIIEDPFGHQYFVGSLEASLSESGETLTNYGASIVKDPHLKRQWIYKADLTGNKELLSSPVSGLIHFADIFFLREKNIAFYSVTRDLQGNLDVVYPELYFSHIDSTGKFLDSHPFPFNKPGKYGIISPFVDETNGRLYFASDMRSENGYDLYYSKYHELNGEIIFSDPLNLGQNVNTLYNERDPFVDPDSGTLYFSSQGYPGLGGLDIYMSKAKEDSTFSTPVNIGRPFNTSFDDFAFRRLADNTIYFSSNRTGGTFLTDYTYKLVSENENDFDFEKFSFGNRNKGMVPDKVSFEFTVSDCNGNSLTSSARIVPGFGTDPLEVALSENNGTYQTEILADSTYILKIHKQGFLPLIDTIKLQNKELHGRNYRLIGLPYGKMVYHGTIHFPFNIASLDQSAQKLLVTIGMLLEEYPFLELQITGHTDDVGSEEFNNLLSQERAINVREKIVEIYGIDVERMNVWWFGERSPKMPCGLEGQPQCSPSENAANRRVELELKVMEQDSVTARLVQCEISQQQMEGELRRLFND